MQAKPALGLSEPLVGGDSVFVGDDLPKLFGPRAALRPEGGSVFGAGISKSFVVPSLI